MKPVQQSRNGGQIRDRNLQLTCKRVLTTSKGAVITAPNMPPALLHDG